jgi:hypothetical protein
VRSQIVDGDGPRERWFSTVPVDETLGGFDDFMEGLSGLQFVFHGLKGASGDVPCISPILQVGFFHH